jgi:LPXTG-motif cell wall-anchored protein
VADSTGALSHTFVVPITTMPGPHEVELRGISSALTMRSPVVEVLAATPPAPMAVARPTTGAPLPATGSDELVLALVAVALIAVGGALVLLEGRRRTGHDGAS